jgi:hypothetical protein
MADDSEKRQIIADELGLDSEDEVDEELVALANEQRSQSILQPVLFMAVIALGVWVISDWWPDIEYFFSARQPVEVGSVTEFASKRAKDPDWEPDLPNNRYVSLSGVPTRRSASEKYRYFKLIGSSIFVEQPHTNAPEGSGGSGKVGDLDSPRRSLRNLRSGLGPDRTYFEGKGRLMKFSEMPQRYQGVRTYYRKNYGTRFCGLMTDQEIERLRDVRRNAIVETWQDRYNEASPEERQEKNLKKRPSEEEIREILQRDPVCIDAYLLRSTVSPTDNWWYLLIAGFFGLFMLVNAYWLVRWFMRFFGTGPLPSLGGDGNDDGS